MNEHEWTPAELQGIKRDDEVWALEKAFWEGAALATKLDRVAAFAAIRRAAQIAREVEREIAEQSEWHDYELHSHGDDGWVPMPVVPEQIRAAIRAAIGSDKAR